MWKGKGSQIVPNLSYGSWAKSRAGWLLQHFNIKDLLCLGEWCYIFLKVFHSSCIHSFLNPPLLAFICLDPLHSISFSSQNTTLKSNPNKAVPPPRSSPVYVRKAGSAARLRAGKLDGCYSRQESCALCSWVIQGEALTPLLTQWLIVWPSPRGVLYLQLLSQLANDSVVEWALLLPFFPPESCIPL